EGTVPLHTLRADIDYGLAEAKTEYGVIGVKVWICKGEIMNPTIIGEAVDRLEITAASVAEDEEVPAIQVLVTANDDSDEQESGQNQGADLPKPPEIGLVSADDKGSEETLEDPEDS
ncbi:MAG: hypothetical protein VX426_04890, partial [Chloroflexota bacterium]|nr:hypothetical protein [Chloroflexota bacterium]